MATKKKKKPVKKPPLQLKLQEEASIRLKAFIEDLRHDPLYKHRLFYPVLYKQTIYKQEHASYQKNRYKGVTAPVAQVIYEYYLFKMERFGDEDTARIFLSILLANGPMLPKEHRFYFKDASAKDSLLNRSNAETIFKRTKVFLEVLQDENLYNFIFRTTIGKELEDMRKRFYELTTGKIKMTKIDMLNSSISNELTLNIEAFHNYFKYIKDKNISEVVHFLIYMGEPRNIITDFSYRPLSLEELEKYRDYIMGYEGDENDIIYKTQLEYALNSNVLQKDLNSQLDSFIPIIAKEYQMICSRYGHSVCIKYGFKISRELENNIKMKLQHTLKRIHDYTYNYISRKLLDENYDDNLFISRILSIIIERMKQNQPITDILRNTLTFTNFIGSNEPDLADLIKSVFKSDVEYIYEMCSDKRYCQTGDSFFSRWEYNKEPYNDAITKIKDNLDGNLFSPILTCLKNNVDKTDSVISNLKSFLKTVSSIIENKLNSVNLLNKSSSYEYVKESINIYNEILEKASENAEKDFMKLLHNFDNESLLDKIKSFFNLTSKESEYFDNYDLLYKLFYFLFLNKLVYREIKKVKDMINNENSLDGIYLLLKHLLIVKNISRYIVKNISEHFVTTVSKKVVTTYNPKTNKDSISECFDLMYEDFKDINNIININKEIVPIESTVRKLIPEIYNCLRRFIPFVNRMSNINDISQFIAEFNVGVTDSSENMREINMDGMASALLMLYFKYYLRPVLISFFSYAFDNFEYASRQDEVKYDIVSKDLLHLNKILDPRTTGILTFDGAVINELTKLTYILLSDTFSGVTYDDPDSVMEFLHKIYGLRYFNVFIYGKRDAYIYLNSAGAIYSYKGVKTKIPIKDLKNNYDFLMDPSRGLYKNISLPKKRKK